MVARVSRLVLTLGWLVLGLGVLLHLTVRDAVPGLALFFYALPKPCLAALAVALLAWPGVGKKARLIATLAVVGIGAWWVALSWHSPAVPAHSSLVTHHSSHAQQPELRVLYWNLCRPSGLHQGMVDLVREFQPHCAAFVEPGERAGQLVSAYETLLPGYTAAWMPRGILWLARVPSRYRERGKLEDIGAFAWFEVTTLGPAFPIVVADVHPHLFHSRKGQLDEALSYAHDRADALLMGDFNTPLESVHLAAYRAQYTHALQVAGQGFQETWPVGLPLLSLDHLWVGAEWEVVAARKVWRLTRSDHAALLVTLRRRQ